MKQIAIVFLKTYKLLISPILPPTCRFYPTCSTYALDAFTKYGFLKGAWLTIKRLVRCHPFNTGGYDPVV